MKSGFEHSDTSEADNQAAFQHTKASAQRFSPDRGPSSLRVKSQTSLPSSLLPRGTLDPANSYTKLQNSESQRAFANVSGKLQVSKSPLKWKKSKGQPKMNRQRLKKPYQRLQGIPLPKSSFSTDSSIQGGQKYPERIDVYYYDHGNCSYYLTTDLPPTVVTHKVAEKTEEAAIRFWAEIFGSIHIAVTFITTFILQFLRFTLFSVVRPLTVGIIQMTADYFIKPLLTILFNGFIQPLFILLYNIATSLKDLCEPIAQALGFFFKEFAHLLQAIRLVDVKLPDRTTTNSPT